MTNHKVLDDMCLAALAVIMCGGGDHRGEAQVDMKIVSQAFSVNDLNKIDYLITYAVSGSPTSPVLQDVLPPGTQLVTHVVPPGTEPTACNPGCHTLYGRADIVECYLQAGASTIAFSGSLPPFSPARLALANNQAAVLANDTELDYANNSALAQFPISNLLGDADGNDIVDDDDIDYLITYLFAAGPRYIGPSNVNGIDCVVSVSDILYLINYRSAAGPPPMPACETCGCVGDTCSGQMARAQTGADELIVGTAVATTDTTEVRLPVYIRDNPGTLIGFDRPQGSRLTQIAFQVAYDQACIDTVSPFFVTGSTVGGAGLRRLMTPRVPGKSQGVVLVSSENRGGALASGGDEVKVGELLFSLKGCGAGVTPIKVTATGSAAASLGSDGSAAETTTNGGLSVINGAITVVK